MGLKGDGAQSSTRRRRLAREAQEFDNGVRESWTLDDGAVVAYHGKTRRPIKAGKRPIIKVSTHAFGPGLTERQRRRGVVRTARSWGRMLDMLKKTGMTMEEFVQGLTPEELVRGRLKDAKGGFTGRPPSWVPHEFHRACMRELVRRGKELWQDNYLVAIQCMTEIAAGRVKGATPGDRLRAAQFVVERLEGKTPEIVLVAEESPWSMVIDDIVAKVPDDQIDAAKRARNQLMGPELADVVDAEIVEEPTPAPSRRRAAARRVR